MIDIEQDPYEIESYEIDENIFLVFEESITYLLIDDLYYSIDDFVHNRKENKSDNTISISNDYEIKTITKEQENEIVELLRKKNI